ncbi:porin family protein [Kaustia mangrovi]|uniref:Porin family protein n=1 Tax=Kaustia mangrovi TaxID=2593653 RepID=A0A7S8C7C0_9HYPH|nr:outer membrane protein [Kaustia mangrovi]QPC44524.1 porin family protein [Kaustia mangrovi]
MTSAAAAAVGAFVTTGAQAADLYVPAPPPPAPVWSWAGPYVGVHAGVVDGDIDDNLGTNTPTPVFTDVRASAGPSTNADSMDPNGIMGGIQAGYNFQFDSIVLGIEGDVSLGDVDDTIYPFVLTPADRMEAQMDWMATIRGRLGWAMDRTLFYVTGGMAFTDLELKVDLARGIDSDKDKNSYFGWTVGGGVEHAFTDNISLKAEYLYTDFGKEKFSFFGGGIEEPPEVSGDAKLKTHTFRVGVNYLF